ncbi:thioredoxin-domain-containing protein [Tothia fuscella]|uniref:Thioredoxin-domain-containing protein n=1 Tax=Tothia fuscella TaxID=1048955 RepID=A0A9P4NTQ1_9PEZI|nr:thioredoxin-domain-containing protein [Tothia fuscella]
MRFSSIVLSALATIALANKSDGSAVTDGQVVVLSLDNYKQITGDSTKDVLVEYFAPWCPHCNEFAPDYEKLAGLFAAEKEHVTIAKFDASSNKIPDVSITGFPSFYLFPANQKDKPVAYEGDRSVEELADFVKEKGYYGVDVLGDDDDE